MKKWIYVSLVLIITSIIYVPSVIGKNRGPGFVHVILQSDGSTNELAEHVKSLGGIVKFRYRNVPALAAAIPADRMHAVAGFPGVTKVEKDRMIRLHDGSGAGENAAFPRSFTVDGLEGVEIRTVDATTTDLEELPEGYAGHLVTGAAEIWEDTDEGAGTIVAVVDTGVVPNVCIDHAVIGAPDFPEGYNATGDGIPATDVRNHYHGTFMGGVIASACALNLSADNMLYRAISAYLPWGPDFIPIFGQAPGAQLYPVKVFNVDADESPNSVILDGLDHILTLKKSGALDIDIVNMSLGGPTIYDGRDTFDRFILELWKANILVVASAGNAGPVPNTVGSPATAFDSIAVGGLDYAASSRVFYEYLGLISGGDEAAGMGLVQRPGDETRVANFSSRGPLSDGRAGPDICAQGTWSFYALPNNGLAWAGGTSVSSAIVAGGAALLNAYWENVRGEETNPSILRRVLMGGADNTEVGAKWQGVNDQGAGALDVAASLDLLKDGKWKYRDFNHKGRFKPNFLKKKGKNRDFNYTGRLKPNILQGKGKKRGQTFESDTLTLGASETLDFVFRIDEHTSNVTVEIFDIDALDNSQYAVIPNRLEINLQSAKRTIAPRPLQALYWYPLDPGFAPSDWRFALSGDAVTIEIEDGPWTLSNGDLGTIDLVEQPMEPGLMKVSLAGDIGNESTVSFKIRIIREDFHKPLKRPIVRQVIRTDDEFLIPVIIPGGVTTAAFDLSWKRNWDRFPTSDIDMVIFDPYGDIASYDGTTLNAPERAVIDYPIAGLWYVQVYGTELYRPDSFKLFLTTE